MVYFYGMTKPKKPGKFCIQPA